jgi:hypothetical protein
MPTLQKKKFRKASTHITKEVNITDGGEFLDDTIRVKDQPLGETNIKENE